jgi:hypothetical protein
MALLKQLKRMWVLDLTFNKNRLPNLYGIVYSFLFYLNTDRDSQ